MEKGRDFSHISADSDIFSAPWVFILFLKSISTHSATHFLLHVKVTTIGDMRKCEVSFLPGRARFQWLRTEHLTFD